MIMWRDATAASSHCRPHADGDPPLLADEAFHGDALPQHPMQTRHFFDLIEIFPVTRILKTDDLNIKILCDVEQRQ
jgi:hypothetical protein